MTPTAKKQKSKKPERFIMAKSFNRSQFNKLFTALSCKFAEHGIKISKPEISETSSNNTWAIQHNGVTNEVTVNQLKSTICLLFGRDALPAEFEPEKVKRSANLLSDRPSIQAIEDYLGCRIEEEEERKRKEEEARKRKEEEAKGSKALQASLQSDPAMKITLETLRKASPLAYEQLREDLEVRGRKLLKEKEQSEQKAEQLRAAVDLALPLALPEPELKVVAG